VLYTNADQFVNKRDLLLAQIANQTPDLILISEMLPKSNCTLHPALFSLPGYSVYLNFNSDCVSSSSIRGVGIFVSQRIHATQVTFNNVDNCIEHVWIRVKMEASDSLLVGCVYRSPSRPISDGVSALCELLSHLSGYSHLLICGDFNLREITWHGFCGTSSNHHIEPFLEVIDSLYLFQHVSEPTRYRSDNTPSLLDLVFTNELDMISDLSYTSPLGNSDHVCIHFDLVCYTELRQMSSVKYNVRAANLDLMKEILQNVDWDSSFSSLNVDNSWKCFKRIYQDAIDRCVPTYRPKIKKNLWTNSDSLQLQRRKDKLWKKYRATCCSSDLINYKEVNNQLRRLTRNLRRNYEKNLAMNIGTKPKAFWKYVNSRVKTRPTIDELRKSDGSSTSSQVEMVNMFNEYFSSVFTSEDDFVPAFHGDSSPSVLDTLVITPQMVWSKLTNLECGKSPGPDGWPTELVRNTADLICLPLSLLYNKSLTDGVLPDDWKKAYVTPLHKSGPRSLVSNYRPVSLTSTIVKIMESILKDNILSHILDNELVSPFQFGFLPGRSCLTQLLNTMDHFTKALDGGYCVDVIYLDFRKAFDSVPHKRLLCKLASFGIQGNILKWIENFLSDRKQQVVLNGHVSRSTSVISGVPQGSVLGPLLFNMFINDLPSVVSSSIFMFADDTKIFRIIKSSDDHKALQSDLDALHAWSVVWQLSFNISKCKLLHFGPNHDFGPYFLNDVLIESTNVHKDLGVLFDNNLKFHDHSATVASKANRMLGLISKSFEFLESEMVVKLYKSLVRPILEYCNPVWGPTFITDQRKIENVQRRATRLIPSIRENTYSERLSFLDLPSMNYRQNRGDLILMYKIIHNYFNSDFSTSITFSTSATRGHQFKIFKHRTRLQISSNFYFNRIVSNWNSLPPEVVNAGSINTFKSLLDNFLIDSKFTFV